MKKLMVLVLVLVVLAMAALGGLVWSWHNANIDRSGWTELEGGKGYLDSAGVPLTSWQDIGGKRYRFDENGVMVTGWLEESGSRYYLGADGVMVTGWQDIEGKRYRFGETGVMVTGWLEENGSRYYLDESGVMVTGWQELEGVRYYFGADGSAVTGEQTVDGQTYCFREDGTLATGWQEIDGKRHYFDESGVMYTGWLELGEDRFYLQADGTAAVGPVEIDGQLWHFSPRGKQIYLVNQWNLLPEGYEPEIVPVDGGRVAKPMAEALERMMADCRAAGLYPIIVSGYRTYWDQSAMYNAIVRAQGETGKLYCAVPNGSEHQLGLAVDIVEYSYRTLNASQENTKTFKWFSEHCWEYGFIVRYPSGSTDITGIAYEPWHYRYVGVETALELRELGITLEEYLGAA